MTVATTAVVAVAFKTSLQTGTTTTGQAAIVSSPAPVHESARPTHPTSRNARRSARPTQAPTQPPTHTPTKTPTPTSQSIVVAGSVVQTQYGPVQVEVTARGGRIVDAHTLQHPSGDGQTDRINSYAVPQLNQETMAAQNAHIDTVSGATFTSGGYRQSLQAALDAAHLGR
ncbi:hypothetical protein GCM10009630_22160 [Kribbella jejuensis]